MLNVIRENVVRLSCLLLRNGKGGIDAVKGGRGDAAGITCTLAAGVEVGRGDGLECIGVARYADCTAAAAPHQG